jgi:penicillin-binding protein 1B
MPIIRKRKKPSPPRPTWRRWLPWVVAAVVALAIGILILRPFWRLSSQFDDLTYRQPSRLYAQPTRLEVGLSYPADRLIEDLRAEGYREDTGSAALPTGRFRKTEEGLAVHLRTFSLSDSSRGGGLLDAAYRGPRVRGLRLDGREVESAVLEPPLLASYYGDDLQERRPVTVDEVSEDLIAAVVAAEDDAFFRHGGVSVSGVLRALWVNLRGGEVRQGGSTLTQQLVKNLYLTHERTLSRKSQELILALLLEARYDKREILEAYLNEIYLGGAGGVSLIGVGAASRAYFGKDPGQLDLAEAATLAGMIQSPANYSPLTHPEKARQRRDWVLGRMKAAELADPRRIERALASPVAGAPEPLVRRRAPYFADAAAEEARRRFGVEELADAGYALFSTLQWPHQREAQEAVDWGLERAEEAYEKKSKAGGPLQGALVSMDPDTGAILAYVGGRNYGKSQFDRAGQARRQPGSAFKPVVYAAAFERRAATPASFLEDSPLSVRLAGSKAWSPKNDDGGFHGWVTVRTAMEKSYNPATARLALEVGMPNVVELARKMGVAAPMEPFPSVALGSVEVTPVELATVYATLASGGLRPPVHGVFAVLDRYGKPVAGTKLPAPERMLSAESAFLVTSLLQGVLVRGTGAGGASPELKGHLAGKTGTTNLRRDSWFAGYSPGRATAVWVGYDDNSPTRLSGARAALPIWNRFTVAVKPRGGHRTFDQPQGITTASIDPTTGGLATEYCPVVLTEYFRRGEAPTESCAHHRSWFQRVFDDDDDEGRGWWARDDRGDRAEPGGAAAGREDAEAGAEAAGDERDERPGRFRRWLKKVLGNEDEPRDEDEDRDDGERPPGEATPPAAAGGL